MSKRPSGLLDEPVLRGWSTTVEINGGPYPTAQMIELLNSRRIDWAWNIWREGMTRWTPVARLFTIPELSNGKIELRDFGQGDGTYRP
jgi:GYF domain 2